MEEQARLFFSLFQFLFLLFYQQIGYCYTDKNYLVWL